MQKFGLLMQIRKQYCGDCALYLGQTQEWQEKNYKNCTKHTSIQPDVRQQGQRPSEDSSIWLDGMAQSLPKNLIMQKCISNLNCR